MQKTMIQVPIISVIIPVYNSEQTVRRCIDSVLKQNFSNFELLLINDGSTDNSGLIINNYCKRMIGFTHFTQRIVGLAVREIWVCEKPKENGLLL